MSDSDSERFKRSPASESLTAAIKARQARPDHATVPLVPQPTDSPSTTDALIDDIYSEFRQWCERKRTCWPSSKDAFLSYGEFMFAMDLGDSHSARGGATHQDYSWVPSVLCDIFHSSLTAESMLNLLDYFLGLLSVLILSDATKVEREAHLYRDLILRTVSPAVTDLTLAPNFLGALEPSEALNTTPDFGLEPEEITLVRDIRRQLYEHLIDRG